MPAVEAKTKSVIHVHALHKSATMFLYKFFGDLSRRKGWEFYSENDDPAFDSIDRIQTPFSHCVCPIRSFDNICVTQPDDEEHFRIIHLRDPRDMLVSEYFSFGWTHSQTDEQLTDERMKEIRSMSIDDYCINQPEFSSWSVDEKLKPLEQIQASNQTIFVQYETMVTQFPRWLADVLKPFNFRLPLIMAAKLALKYRNEFKAPSESLTHKRKITPGDHVQKLNPKTIAILNDRFHDFLVRFEYLR